MFRWTPGQVFLYALGYVKHVMSATIEDVARSLGISVRGVRLRVDALRGVIDSHLRQGENNRLLFDGEALAILRRLEELRQAEAISIRQAASRIRKELDENGDLGSRQSAVSVTTTDPLRELVEELRKERDQWRELALKLQTQVEELTIRALPAPRRRGLFAWFRGIRLRGQ